MQKIKRKTDEKNFPSRATVPAQKPFLKLMKKEADASHAKVPTRFCRPALVFLENT